MKKRTTIRHQFNFSILIGISIAMLVMYGSVLFFLFGQITTLINQASSTLEGYVTTMASDLELDLEETNIKELVQSERFIQAQEEINNYQDILGIFVSDMNLIINEENEYLYVFGFNSDGEIEPLSPYDGNDEKLINTIETGTTYSESFTPAKIFKHETIDSYIPIEHNGNILGGLHIGVNSAFINAIFIFLIIALLVIVGIQLLVISLVVRFVANKQAKQIEILRDKVQTLSQLEGDMTQRVEIKSNNEIGELATYINTLLDTIQSFMLTIRNYSESLDHTSTEFGAVISDTATAAELIDKKITDMTENVNEHKQITIDVLEHIETINASVNEVAENAQEVAEEAAKADDNIVAGMDLLATMNEHVVAAVSKVEETSANVDELNELSLQINQIVDAITGIASQTNLLALNASIEAARAGEQGRGFAVVAEEVRKLAEESAKQAEDISLLIHKVQVGINNASNSMDVAKQTMSKETEMVSDVSTRFNIITESMRQVSSRVEGVSSQTQEMASSTTIVASEVERLSSMTEETAALTKDVADNVHTQNKSVVQLSSEIDKIEHIANDLNTRMNNLKLD